MDAHVSSFAESAAESTSLAPADRTTCWTTQYAERHRLRRFTEFPSGIAAPRKVRIYQRQSHFMLQWWDRQAKRTLSERIDGDLLVALARARELDDRLALGAASDSGAVRIGHDHLLSAFLADLERRANAGELCCRMLCRYRSALLHYQDFVAQPDVSRRHKNAAAIDRAFRLEFMAYLSQQIAAARG